MEATPMRLRRLIIELYEAGESTAEIAERVRMCESGVRRIRQNLRERGTLAPLPRRAGRRQALDAAEMERLRQAVEKRPDATLAELREAVGNPASIPAYCRAVKRLGLTRKKSRCTPRSVSVRT